MSLTFRDEKGAPLSSAEQDANIRTLRDMILDLQNNPTPGVGIVDIVQSGSTLTVHLSSGATLGPYTLPTANLRYRDEWAAETVYLAGDFFKIENEGLYVVRIQHTSDPAFDAGRQIGGEFVYSLAVPYFPPSPGWEPISIESNEAFLDLSVSDKFLLTVDDDVEIQTPSNVGPTAPPFALRLVIGSGGPHAVTWASGYLGAAPSVLDGEGDETVLSGMVLDRTLDEETEEELSVTAIINAVKSIPAPEE